mmetsp:Transcript_44349/g.118793  ORF Transcript_44349/g.118793 Transcript_44349/m.118793 type:complete len:126 (-) Transcript_44349:315-692(-)
MGEGRPHAENARQNSLLRQDIEQLCLETGGVWWHSFGFATDWHEKGFTVAAPREKVIDLARKYKQGAVYRFVAHIGSEDCMARLSPPFVRQTVPVLVSDTEADVLVEPTRRPDFEQADPHWEPPF